jgi:hypothetical protein
MMDKDLAKLLKLISQNRSPEFSGVGIIATDRPGEIPITPLRKDDPSLRLPITGFEECLRIFLKMSDVHNQYHDGFHVLVPPFSLIAVSQFFSTPIVPGAIEDYTHGSRFRTALYGSKLPGIVAVGVVSQQCEASIFVDGKRFNPDEFLAYRSDPDWLTSE